ncbi:hypothetical protein CYMTET_21404 [Cymbomonas tetramitiformis]|uniref:Uncharacterized protein n=1 Tax=Cymbomonas tetramitiformis TaxID=36881 RepID=A0AAE0L3B3_9CHLO|nr:hypothetical protein CYMTET_21404 [Cymbomonas tetramitiformis]
MVDLSEIISDAVVAKLQQSQSENVVSAGSVQSLKVTAHSEEQLEEKPVVDAAVADAAMLEGSQEVRSEGQSEEKPATDATVACSEEQPNKDASVVKPPAAASNEPPIWHAGMCPTEHGQARFEWLVQQMPVHLRDDMMASIRVKHAISKSSEGLTLKEAVQLGFLKSSDLAAVVDELPPFDAVRHVGNYLATINLKAYNSEGVERQWKDPANTAMYRMDTPSPPSSEAEPILSAEVDNPGTPENEPKLKEPMTPTPNAARLQLAKVRRSSMDTMVNDGGGDSATVANDQIETEEE